MHRGSGRWQARLTVDGRRIARYADSQSEAWKILEALRRKSADGLSMRADQVKVADYLTAWLDDVAAFKVRPRTLEGYRQHVRDHIAPALGRHTLATLSAGHVQRMIKDKAAAGLSPATVQRIRATLRLALADAERKGIIGRNPARFVDLPAVRRNPPEALEPERAAAILEAVKGHRLEALIIVAMFTGMRQGELLGLPWKAVDLVAGRLTVGQALSRRTAAAPILAEPKTKRSRRTLPLPPLAVAALRAHGERQRFEQKTAGDAWQNADGLVFVAQDGGPLDASTALRALRLPIAAAGLPRMRFHDLRHAYATLALQAGAGLREVMEGLGHADIGTTGNVYAHVTPATLRRVADDLEALVTGAGKGAAKGGG
ncbi:MAG: site-specific integrase [Ardenticatenia bacterium]|nr:site-specific integrase [Ardenticatenia bacterium]